MILDDLMILEDFYGPPACAAFFEDMAGRYGPDALLAAIQHGYVSLRRVEIGPDAGRALVCLSALGRSRAAEGQRTI